MDDIVYGVPLGPRVKTVKPMDDYMLFLEFDNGEQRIFDVKPSFKYDVYKPILDIDVFNTVKVDYGTVVWLGDIDYCPDSLYARSVLVTEDMVYNTDFPAVAESKQPYEHK